MPIEHDYADYAEDLRSTVERIVPVLLALPEPETARCPAPGKWSPREIIGHLIDSASNNHQRFVRAQLQDDLVFDGYDQDAWVAAQRYHDAPWADLVALWSAFNRHIAWLMRAAPPGIRTRPRARHNLDRVAFRPVHATEPATLEYFMKDYVEHLKHHLQQIPTVNV